MGFKLTPEYLAGFFDGEGSVGVYPRLKDRTKTKTYFVLVVSLAQSGKNGYLILSHLQKIFGGTVYKSNGKNKDVWKWNLSSKKAVRFLNVIKDFCLIKREEILLALQFQETDNKSSLGDSNIELSNKIKQLKRR